MDGVGVDVLVTDFPQQLRRNIANVLDFYLILLDAYRISMTPILNQNVKDTDKGSWVPLNIRTSEAAKAAHTR